MNGRQIALASLACGAIGTAFAGFQLWPKAENPAQSEAVAPVAAQQPAEGSQSSNCTATISGGQQGNITCNNNVAINTPLQVAGNIKRVEFSINESSAYVTARELEKYEGKIVYISGAIDPAPEESKIYGVYFDDNEDIFRLKTLDVTVYEKCEGFVGFECGGTSLYFKSVDEHSISWVNGYHTISGYFLVRQAQGMHQGITSLVLQGMKESEVALADPGTR
ncbi:hypothetical protein GVN21_09715 [Caulobacter sp. SLTY]|uniref:hypothetical protein n=1 Tax=Caulobacter sp. SLTY TaxID=2683262 RepID=UPI001411CBDD|nr:hypothetical protein [Caulobacter sp. SLTY]NBB15629.1 hypothetical protein [Caulobacter sp. SLTY]